MRMLRLLLVLALPIVTALAADSPVDPRGPIANPGMTVAAGEDGIQTPGYRFVNPGAKPGPWQGEWIWLPTEARVGAAACLRKEVTLADAPRQATAWISGDTKYRLWINGRLVARGPVDIGKDYAGGSTGRWFYDTRDIAPFLHKGRNVIAAEVFRQWPIGFTISRGQPGFLFEAALTLPDAGTVVVKSDATWRGTAASHYPRPTAYDAGKEPAGWRLPGFDDQAWSACIPAGDHWSPLVPSEIPPLMEGRYPVLRIENTTGGVKLQPDGSILATADGSFSVLFDRVLSAHPAFIVNGGAGAVITIKAHRHCEMQLGGGEQFFEFPFMTEIVPAYTVTLSKVTTPVAIRDLGATFTSQPVAYAGSFACSDDKLNAIWKAARWAVQICLQTHHLDSPNHQEPISDPGDYLIESMVAHYAFRQPWLARQDVRKFAWLLKDEKYLNFHISYSMGWLQMLMDYYDFTGDRTLVEEMAPYVHELLDTYAGWRGRNGILSEAPNYMFMDWVTIGGFGCHHPPAVIGQGYLTAFYYHGMEQASRVAQMLGDAERVAKYARLRSEIAAAFQRELWVDAKGLYRDGKPFQSSVKPHKWMPEDKDIETFSPHVNLLAVLYDLAPKDRQAAIVERVLAEKPLNTQPWFMHWVFQAIDHAGLTGTHATGQMRRWCIIPETQSFKEMWNGGDRSHGWCSTPLVQMSGLVLGITPAEPGFRRIAIRPTLCDLTWAKGAVPTPHGAVAVIWTLEGGRLQLSVTVPAGTEADVTIPTGRFDHAVVTADGKAVAGADPTVHVAAGSHQFTVGGTLKALPVAVEPVVSGTETTAAEADAFEAEVVKGDLIHAGPACRLVRVEDHCSHPGGGTDTAALLNGTTRNGNGGAASADDGRTFRGYGTGDHLVLHLDAAKSRGGYDLTRILSFAGHADARAGQHYTLSLAFAAAPERFVPFGPAVVASTGGGTIVRTVGKDGGVCDNGAGCRAKGVVAVRFDFTSGSHGFNCYREFCVVGTPAP